MSEYLYHLKRAAYFLTSLSAISLTFLPSLAAVPRLSHGFAICLFWISALCLLAAYGGFTRRADVVACCSSGVLIGASLCALAALTRKGALFYTATGPGARFTIHQIYFLCGQGLWILLLAWGSFSFFMAAWLVLTKHIIKVGRVGTCSKPVFADSRKVLELSGIDRTSTDCI